MPTPDQPIASDQARAELLELTHDAIFLRDPESIIRYWNRGAVAMYVWTAAEALGQSSHRLLATESPQPFSEIEAALTRDGFWEGELVHRNRDRRRIVVASRWTVQRDPGGRLLAYLEVNNDITARKESEARFQERARRLAAIIEVQRAIAASGPDIESALAAIVQCLPTLTHAGGAAVALRDGSELVYRAASGIARPFLGLRLSVKESLSGLCLRQRQILRSDDTENDPRPEAEACRRLGMRSMVVAPLAYAGAPGGVAKVVSQAAHTFDEEDVTTLRLLAGFLAATLGNAAAFEDRQTALSRMEEVIGELEAFTYTVSHDLRAPLRGMRGFAEALLEDYTDLLDASGREYAQRIVAAVDSMNEMIQDLLDYSRLSRADLHLQPVDLEAELAAVLQRVESDVEDNGARLEIERPLPRLNAHPATLRHVLANLISNALTFVPAGAPPQIRIRATRKDSMVRVEVADRGIGIAPEYHDRIFHVFERLHGSETYPGTGIGLAIVRKGAERMGGRAGVESAPGTGSRVWFELPAVEDSAARQRS